MGFANGYQNLELTISPQVNGLVFKHEIELYVWLSQANVRGTVTSTYDEPLMLKASIQQENTQNLTQISGIDYTKIYYRFYLQSDSVTGLNRPGGVAQDYIIWDSQRYTIVSINDTFRTGWKYVIGCQDTDE